MPTDQTLIEPEVWYSEIDVLLKLDIQRSVQAQARQAGTLQFTKAGDTYLYKGSAILSWIEAGAPTTANGRAKRSESRTRGNQPAGASPPASRTVGNRSGMTMAEAYSDPVAEFTRRVEALVGKGVDSNAAPGAIARTNPELYEAYLQATNPQPAASSPGAAALANRSDDAMTKTYTDSIGEFDRAVRAKMDKGLDRDAAVRAVTKAQPGLHKAFLKATNPGRPGDKSYGDHPDHDVT